MLGLQLNHVSKRGPCSPNSFTGVTTESIYSMAPGRFEWNFRLFKLISLFINWWLRYVWCNTVSLYWDGSLAMQGSGSHCNIVGMSSHHSMGILLIKTRLSLLSLLRESLTLQWWSLYWNGIPYKYWFWLSWGLNWTAQSFPHPTQAVILKTFEVLSVWITWKCKTLLAQ